MDTEDNKLIHKKLKGRNKKKDKENAKPMPSPIEKESKHNASDEDKDKLIRKRLKQSNQKKDKEIPHAQICLHVVSHSKQGMNGLS